ncbi:MAG: glycyl radical protein [Anaerolineales bacterium]|nr:glycyl radical protein [Anaerolineales bacterium]
MKTDRVAKLRKESMTAIPCISAERAKLVTDYNRNEYRPLSIPVQRAMVFKTIMENKAICINSGELIVGERGPAPKATPTYPEICCHSIQDLEVLDSREKVSFKVGSDVRRVYQDEIIPFWSGKTMRERIFDRMTDEWKSAYQAGIFTEFMEQRAPGHTVLDDKIYHKGMLDMQREIRASLERLDFLNDPGAAYKQQQLEAMSITADALIRFAERHAEKALELAREEADPTRRVELERIAAICSHVPAHAPRNFWEALQMYWFVHLGIITELNPWDAISPGRLDQHLITFYRQGLTEGTLTREGAEELLQCLWIKFNNHPAPSKVGVTAEESSTYTDFANINNGGLTPDGADGVNEVTYLILDVIEEMRLVQPSSNIQLSKKNPDRFLSRAARIIRTGFGQPSIFNADVVVQELVRQGKSIKDARCGGTSGCVETGAFGKENYNLTGYFNLPKILEITLNDGIDPASSRRIGVKTGDPTRFKSFDELWGAYVRQMTHFVDIKVRGSNVIERLYADYLPVPFLSLFIDDCIATGVDYHNGGARYNTSYIQGVGLGTITDAITAIKYHIYEHGTWSMDSLLQALKSNFEGYETIRQVLINKTPKYGNDLEYPDTVMQQIFDAYYEAVHGRPNTKGGRYEINMLPTTVHIYFGSVTGALPDGRKAREPLSEGVSPVQGADRNGPTAVVKSVSKMDHIRTGGTLLNQKFTPQLLADDTGISKLVQLVRTFFKLDGHHIQFNVVDATTLVAAQREPEKYRDLIVRVAGYSDYFCDLSEALQNEIIERTEHQTL